ncbi:MAG: hypothetical protein AAGE61_15475 [Pseudomonadota bacterium]
MTKRTKFGLRTLSVGIVAGALAMSAAPVEAERLDEGWRLQIGVGSGKSQRGVSAEVRRLLAARGFTEIEVFRVGLKGAKARACLEETRYEVTILNSGRIAQSAPTGPCRQSVGAAYVQEKLTRQGFTRVLVEPRNSGFIALVCRNKQRMRLAVSQFGDVTRARQIGRCATILEPNDIEQALKDQGYNRIRFTDRQLPWYKAEACKKNQRVELLLTRFAEVRRTIPIGKCAPPLKAADLQRFLASKGYSRVAVIDPELPRYGAEACKDGRRVELQLTRFGRFIGERDLGICVERLSRGDVAELVKSEGYRRVRVKKASNTYEIDACREKKRVLLKVSLSGDFLGETVRGPCTGPSITNIHNNFVQDGVQKLRIFAFGCKKGQKVRYRLDEFGKVTETKIQGTC